LQQSNGSELTQDDQEFSLWDILIFLQRSWKPISIFGLLGLCCSSIYLFVTPKKYEALAQIRMAQISQINPANPFGTPVEDPLSLISRIQFPTNYPENVINACGYEGKADPVTALSKNLKFSLMKGVANAIELKVIGSTPQTAFKCAQSVFEQIVILQEQVSRPFVEEARIKLIADNERIDAARALISKADRSGGVMSATYLAARDELNYFLTDREKMTDLINSVKNRGTRLASPIYVSDNPTSPKKILSLVIGLFGGLFLGLLTELFRCFLKTSGAKRMNQKAHNE
jgi:hypothetical protein